MNHRQSELQDELRWLGLPGWSVTTGARCDAYEVTDAAVETGMILTRKSTGQWTYEAPSNQTIDIAGGPSLRLVTVSPARHATGQRAMRDALQTCWRGWNPAGAAP